MKLSWNRTVYTLIFFISGILSGPLLFAQGSWERLDVPGTQTLRALSFVDTLYGWAAGDSGTILHTINGGDTWILQESGTSLEIHGLFFLNRRVGWATAFNYSEPPFGTILLKTIDGGENWTSTAYPDENLFMTCICFLDSLNGWMGGKPHALVKTTDGGISWTQANVDTSVLAFFPVLNLVFLNEEVGFAAGGIFDIAGVIWRTFNGGELWEAIDPSQAPADEVHGLVIFDGQRIMASGGDPDYGYGVGMMRSSDSGVNWSYEDIGIQGIAFDLDFRTPSQAWSPLGPQRSLIYSLDSGNTWTEIPSPGETEILRITFPDSLHGFGVGTAGAVIRFIPPVPPGIGEKEEVAPPVRFSLFPNPVADRRESVTCKVQSVIGGTLNIRILDQQGREHQSISERFIPAGSHSLTIPTGIMPAGMYLFGFYWDGRLVETQKVVCP